MIETVSTLEIRQRLGDLPNRIALWHDKFVIECKGKPLAARIPLEQLEQMQEAARLYLLSVLDRKPKTIAQGLADELANEAKHRTRKARRK